MDEFNNSKQPKQIELLWRDRVQRHINSGKSQAKFCLEEQCSLPALAYWRDRFKVSSKRKPSIAAELSLRDNHFVDAGPLSLEIPDSKKPESRIAERTGSVFFTRQVLKLGGGEPGAL